MKFFDAVEFANSKEHLIGTTTPQGGTIDEIIIVPSNLQEREQFEKCYINKLAEGVDNAAQQCIVPYLQSEVSVVAVVDKRMIASKRLVTVFSLSE